MNGQPLGLELSNAHPEQLNPAILKRVLGALRIMFYSSRPLSCPITTVLPLSLNLPQL